MRTKIGSTLFFSALVCISGMVEAGSLAGKITFDKRPPLGGVIYVKNTASVPANAAIDQKNKSFTKNVMAGNPGAKAIFRNNDSQDHNIFANDIEYGVNFDVGLIASGSESEISMDWKQDSIVRIGCKIHPKMKAYIANINSDNFSVLEFSKDKLEYSFELKDVKSEDNNFVLKLPKYGDIEVALKPGQTETFELMRKGKKKGTISLSRK